MAERVFITGCGGMLGDAIYPHFSSLYRPDMVVHLAAETDLEYCESHPNVAKETNALATQTVAKLSEKYGATLIYISTAGVFDGLKTGPYTELDKPNPIMVYGQTKYEGELYALKYCRRTFVVRAGWMMGGGRRKEKKFIYKILQQVSNGSEEIYAVDDKWGTPTYAYDFASNLIHLLRTKKYGTYHMACEGRGTRYDVAKMLLQICNRPDVKLTPVSSKFFKERYFAPRPRSEMMLNANLHKLGLNNMRPWGNSLRDYIEEYFHECVARPERLRIRTSSKTFIRIREMKSSVLRSRLPIQDIPIEET
jgi:dTDP-4-dehydrorhamnose reductase